MKKITTAIAVIIALIFSIVIVYTMSGRDYRSDEISQATISAMESAAKLLLDKTQYSPSTNEEFEAAYISALTEELNAKNLDYTINIISSDWQTGIIRAEVVASYKHPNGNSGSVSVDRTIIMEDYTGEIPEKYPIIFAIGENNYREWDMEANSTIIAPNIPADCTGTKWVAGDGSELVPGDALTVTGANTYTLQ